MPHKKELANPKDVLIDKDSLRVVIADVKPKIDEGEFAVKKITGDKVVFSAVILCDSHDEIYAHLLLRHCDEKKYKNFSLNHDGNDNWSVSITLDNLGNYYFAIEAWVDRYKTWLSFLKKKLDCNIVEKTDLLDGLELFASYPTNTQSKKAKQTVKKISSRLSDLASSGEDSFVPSKSLPMNDLESISSIFIDKRSKIRTRFYEIRVDPILARFGSWYEFFPRSFVKEGKKVFKSCDHILDYISNLNFNVIYLPPIHPIGLTNRKGKNNTLSPSKSDVGSPWAIGSSEGGHKSIHPDLGDFHDFSYFVEKASQKGLLVALDLAFQCSPDHPYVKKHPDWFYKRADGSIHYAENPPKKYQDIYPLNFECDDWRNLWNELASVVEFWCAKKIRIFRVDNPHTKALRFWSWLIRRIKMRYPDTIFLSEAFTRPHRMEWLSKAGFCQSYTYFTWRNSKHEIQEFVKDFTAEEKTMYFRPNLWPNTPDILPDSLHLKGQAAFIQRFILASTLSSNYGIYGPAFEQTMNERLDKKSDEYLDSEKYEIKSWDLGNINSINWVIKKINHLRNQYTSLQYTDNISFIETHNEKVIAYYKRGKITKDNLIIIVNLNCQGAEDALLEFDPEYYRAANPEKFFVRELLQDVRYEWHGKQHYIRLDPCDLPAHILAIDSSTSMLS